MKLSKFSIHGLHGKLDVEIPIYDNRLILVGVNGLGKTTVVNLLFFILTEQWQRILRFDFRAVELWINDAKILITKEDIQNKLKLGERYEKIISRYAARSPFPSSLIRSILLHPNFQYVNKVSGSRDLLIKDISLELGIPSSYVARVLLDIPPEFQEDLFESKTDPQSILNLYFELKNSDGHQVIYLPTYRRIEQDLKAIFPGLEDDELRRFTNRIDAPEVIKHRGHVELVQFGMHDVEAKISTELEKIQKRTRSQLSSLTASYLQDIIRSRADKFEPELIRSMDETIVKEVLSRVEENTLSSNDKHEVELAIRRIKNGNTNDVRDKYLTYFFSRLLEIYSNLAKSEGNIRRLVETCNRYFERKQVFYNDTDFTASIRDIDDLPLNWKVLSSGEKQVASLFTHLYLTHTNSQIVIIDEPELSLSVPWQKSLLPDISNSDKCELLVAVTHSPFIYANELAAYAVDLSKCISASKIVSVG